ncbi:tetratricopeptide repeat protein [Streptomyces lavendulae subsp. lavendulae]|nr:tetratricopeptide repeat protein [Streptomyces lavendulae subsp. lavendulae]
MRFKGLRRGSSIDTSALMAGVVCLIAAIGSGGVEAMGLQLPAVDSWPQQLALGVFGAALLGVGALERLEENSEEDPMDARDSVAFPSPTPRPRLSSRFTGRAGILSAVGRLLDEHGRVSLTGLGGVGKTQTALAYIQLHRRSYDVICWVRAEEGNTLSNDYVEIARVYGVEIPDGLQTAQKIDVVRNWLEAQARMLLVFDNADSEESLDFYLPTSGHVLVTSRESAWRDSRVMVIPPWSRDESLEFLSPPDSEVQAASSLSAYLGDLPLALDQASAYMRETHMSISDYLALLRERTSEVIALGGVANYPRTVATAWTVSMEAAHAKMPVTQDLQRLSSFYAAEGIPHALLRTVTSSLPRRMRALAEDRIAYNRAVSQLSRYSLAQINQNELTFHRLVQLMIRQSMSSNDRRRWSGVAVEIMRKAFPEEVSSSASWDQCATLLPHALSAAEHAQSLNVSMRDVSLIYNRVATYLRVQGRYQESLEIWEKLEQVLRRPHDFMRPDLPDVLNGQGMVLRARGLLTRAQAVLEESVRLQEESRGGRHPRVAVSLNSLGTVLRGLGLAEEARECHVRALSIEQDSLGSDHPNCAVTLNNLGNVERALRRPSEAVDAHTRALRIREESLGPDHPDVGTTLNNLANAQADLGDFAGARLSVERAVRVDQGAFGDQHPAVAADLIGLGIILGEHEEFTEAETALRSALSVNEVSMGPEHADTGVTLNNLGVLKSRQSQYEESRLLLERAVHILEAGLSPDHTDVAVALCNLSASLAEVGDVVSAEAARARATRIWLASGAGESVDIPQWLRLDKDVATAEIELDQDLQ